MDKYVASNTGNCEKIVFCICCILLCLMLCACGAAKGEIGEVAVHVVTETEAATYVDASGLVVPVKQGQWDQETADDIAVRINEYRANNNLHLLSTDEDAYLTFGMKRAEEISINFSRKSNYSGGDFWQSGTVAEGKQAELIAKGFQNAAEVVEAWCASDAHRAVITDPDYTCMTVAVFHDDEDSYYVLRLW